jgi:hypothetical protein
VTVAKIDVLFDQLIGKRGEADEDQGSAADLMLTGYRGIRQKYNENPLYRKKYEEFLEAKIADIKNLPLEHRLRVAVLLYDLNHSDKNKGRIDDLVKSEVHTLLKSGESATSGIATLYEETQSGYMDEAYPEMDVFFMNVLFAGIEGFSDEKIVDFSEVFPHRLARDKRTLAMHPLFFLFFQAAISLTESDDASLQEKGLVTIRNIAGSTAETVILGVLARENRIEKMFLDTFLSTRAKRFRGSKLPKTTAELESWMTEPKRKCYIDYWSTSDGREKFKRDKDLLLLAIEGRCK